MKLPFLPWLLCVVPQRTYQLHSYAAAMVVHGVLLTIPFDFASWVGSRYHSGMLPTLGGRVWLRSTGNGRWA